MAKKEEINPVVFCKECAHSSDIIGMGAFCKVLKRRVCTCDKYGRMCNHFKKRK